MKKNYSKLIIASALVLGACGYNLTNIEMPETVAADGVFPITASVVMDYDENADDKENDSWGCFAVRLPEGWEIVTPAEYTEDYLRDCYTDMYTREWQSGAPLNITCNFMPKEIVDYEEVGAAEAYDTYKNMGAGTITVVNKDGSKVSYAMIYNWVYSGMANSRYNKDIYNGRLDYNVSYVGFTSVEKVHIIREIIDHIEFNVNVRPVNAEVGKEYKFELLIGDEEQTFYQYVGDEFLYSNGMDQWHYDNANCKEDRLFHNGTFNSQDAFTIPGGNDDGTDKYLRNSIEKVFAEGCPSITITEAQGDGVQAVEAAAKPEIKAVAGGVQITGNANVAVYDLQGRKVAEQAVNGNATISLPMGQYIVKSNSTVAKAAIR